MVDGVESDCDMYWFSHITALSLKISFDILLSESSLAETMSSQKSCVCTTPIGSDEDESLSSSRHYHLHTSLLMFLL